MPGGKKPDILTDLRNVAEHRMKLIWRALPAERRRQIKAKIHPASAAKATRAVTAVTTAPKPAAVKAQVKAPVAVIVVVSDEGQDAAATLRSLAAQKTTALQVVIIDTTIGQSAEAVSTGYTERDAGTTYIASPGSTEAEARLLGAGRSTGAYLLFVMAGDVVAKGSIARLLTALRNSGSDFAAGTAGIRSGKKFAVSAAQQRIHLADQPALTVSDLPQILADEFLGSKLFRRSFWTRALAAVDPAAPYWQHELLQTAYLRAESFDICAVKVLDTISDEGARGLVREEICNRANLQARLQRTVSLDQQYRDAASPEVRSLWLTQELGYGLFRFYEVVPRTDDAYWAAIADTLQHTAGPADVLWNELRLHNRLILAAALTGSRQDVVRICEFRSDYGSSFATTFADGRLEAAPPYLADLETPLDPDLLEMQDVDLKAVSLLNQFRWLSDGRLELGGYAYIGSLDPVAGQLSIQADVVGADGAVAAALDVRRHADPRIDWDANDNWTSYAEAGFSVVLDPEALLGTVGPDGTPAWHLRLTLTAFGRTVTGFITRRDMSGATGSLPVAPLTGGRRLAVELRPATTGLTLLQVTPMYVARAVSLTGRTLRLTVEAQSAPLAAKIAVECLKLGIRATATCLSVDGNTAEYELKLPALGKNALPRTEYEWQIRLDSGFKAPQPVAWHSDTAALEAASDQSRRLRAKLTGYGFLAFEERAFRVEATSVDFDPAGNVLTIAGTADLPVIHAPEFVLSSGKAVLPASGVSLHVTTNDGSNPFTATFHLLQQPWSLPDLMLESGAYSVRYVPPGTSDTPGYWFPAGRSLQAELPRRIGSGLVEVGLSRSPAAAALTVHIRPPFAPDETGRYNQQRLRQEAAEAAAAGDLRDGVLFMAFAGKRATDSPRRFLEELQRRGTDWPLYWAVADFAVPVPAGTTPVLIGSREWYRLLSSVRILVNNNNFPFYFRKREGQTYIQTWHGTPLKKLGNDVARTNFSLSYWNLMSREASYWDVLLAQNDYAADVLARCFGFEGPVVAEGYPRNDSLKAGNVAQLRADVRSRLGIPAGKTAILYAPTWRDDAKNAARQYEMVTYLDFEKAQRQLGDDYVLLLRGHHNIAGQRQTAGNRFVIDVTEYPEVNDLYIAADILVNDYSSVMFDFCVTGKPIIFLTPDIEQYRDSTRGFYFDLEERAPGPLLRTTEEVVRAIKNLGPLQRRYARKYESFVQTFAPHDDGTATARVLDRLPLPDAVLGSVQHV